MAGDRNIDATRPPARPCCALIGDGATGELSFRDAGRPVVVPVEVALDGDDAVLSPLTPVPGASLEGLPASLLVATSEALLALDGLMWEEPPLSEEPDHHGEMRMAAEYTRVA